MVLPAMQPRPSMDLRYMKPMLDLYGRQGYRGARTLLLMSLTKFAEAILRLSIKEAATLFSRLDISRLQLMIFAHCLYRLQSAWRLNARISEGLHVKPSVDRERLAKKSKNSRDSKPWQTNDASVDSDNEEGIPVRRRARIEYVQRFWAVVGHLHVDTRAPRDLHIQPPALHLRISVSYYMHGWPIAQRFYALCKCSGRLGYHGCNRAMEALSSYISATLMLHRLLMWQKLARKPAHWSPPDTLSGMVWEVVLTFGKDSGIVFYCGDDDKVQARFWGDGLARSIVEVLLKFLLLGEYIEVPGVAEAFAYQYRDEIERLQGLLADRG